MICEQVSTDTLGEGWLALSRAILDKGRDCVYTDNAGEAFPVKELLGLTLTVSKPSAEDRIIQKFAVPEEFEWMRKNFEELGAVPELHNADSYGFRFYSYMGIKDQIQSVIARLKEEPRLRSATITTLEPLVDEKYIPCVSLLDFSVEQGRLCLYLYCRALDLGTKAYANFALLHRLQRRAAWELSLDPGDMTLFIKSAHIYEKDLAKMQSILAEAAL